VNATTPSTIPSTMTAAVLYGKEDVRIEQVPVPQIGEGEILVRVKAALTDGTDLKVFLRGYHSKMIVPPALFGHELAGTVEQVGAGVKNLEVGMRVVALNSAPCDICYFCQHRQQNLCNDLLFNNGAYAEFIRIPRRIVEKNTLVIPSHVDFATAAMTEPLSCVVRGIEETGVHAGETVIVLGGGPIGLSFMQVAAIEGCRVIAIVKHPEQVILAKHFGAQDVVQLVSSDDPIKDAIALTPDSRGADAVIEAVGRPEAWQQAVQLVRRGGVVNFFGGPPSGTKVELDTNLLHYSEITLKASFHHTPTTVRKAFKLLCDGKVKSKDYITNRAPIEKVAEVLRSMSQRGSSIKTEIVPGKV